MNKQAQNIIKYQNQIARPLVLDGAIGSLLQQRNIEMLQTLWSSYANIVAPEMVVVIHKDYINAGADIITTNTFRTNPIAYNKSLINISNSEFVTRSVNLAIEASAESNNILIAGSNPPAQDSYSDKRIISKLDLEMNHKKHIDMLWESGVDFILNETQSHFDEIRIICEYCSKNHIPYILSLFVTDSAQILSGENLQYVLEYVNDFIPLAIGINCIKPKIFSKVASKIITQKRWGFYLNCGSGNYTDKEIYEGLTPLDYLDIVKQNSAANPFFIGTCCGSSPKHTKLIKEYLVTKN